MTALERLRRGLTLSTDFTELADACCENTGPLSQ